MKPVGLVHTCKQIRPTHKREHYRPATKDDAIVAVFRYSVTDRSHVRVLQSCV